MVRALAHPRPDRPRPGQESVWDYPRPPRCEATTRHLRIEHAGRIIAETRRPWRILETSHPPTWYVPREDVDAQALKPVPNRRSLCEYKGFACYFDVVVGGRVAPAAAWSYPQPTGRFALLAGAVAFYCHALDRCTVDGELARPQPGGFYGGWVTDDVAGPFKGVPGSEGW